MISVIIPIFNVEPFLKECLDSVVSQTYQNLEVLLIDDCGTDNSLTLAQDYIKNYNGSINIRIISHHKNGGLSASRNTGLDHAKGDYIFFLDGDDVIASSALEKLFIAINDGNYAIAISYFQKYTEGKLSTYNECWLFSEARVVEPENFASQMLMEKSNHASTAKLYRKEVLKDVRFRLGLRNEDVIFNLDLIPVIEKNHYRCIDLPYYDYYYRMRDGSICHDSRPLYIDIINNYYICIDACSDKSQLVEWLKQRQIYMALYLAHLFLWNKQYSDDFYYANNKHFCNFSNLYIYKTRSFSEFRQILGFKYTPHLYMVLFRLIKRVH